VLALHKEAKARAVKDVGDMSNADTSLADESKVAEAGARTSTPTKTQGADMVAETPDSSLDAELSAGTASKTPAHTSPKHMSPKRCMASVRIEGGGEGGGGPKGPSLTSRSEPAEKEALQSEAHHGARKTLAETLTESAGDAGCAAKESASAEAACGDKRRREGEGAVQGGGEAGLVEQEDAAVEEQVESHRRGAEKSYTLYHDLLAKRARLTREVGVVGVPLVIRVISVTVPLVILVTRVTRVRSRCARLARKGQRLHLTNRVLQGGF